MTNLFLLCGPQGGYTGIFWDVLLTSSRAHEFYTSHGRWFYIFLEHKITLNIWNDNTLLAKFEPHSTNETEAAVSRS